MNGRTSSRRPRSPGRLAVAGNDRLRSAHEVATAAAIAASNVLPVTELPLITGPEWQLVLSELRRFREAATGLRPRGEIANFSPLVVRGDRGTGKTRLLDEAGLGLPPSQLLRESAVEFSHRQAVLRQPRATARLEQWREERLAVPWWVLDDADALAARPGAQQELCRLLDSRAATSGLTTLAFRALPRKELGFRDALVSRLQAGLVVDLPALALPTRQRMIAAAAAPLGATFEIEAADCLASEASLSTAELLSAATVLAMGSEQGDRRLTRRMVADYLDRWHAARRPTLAQLAKAVAAQFRIPLAGLQSKSRAQSIVRARGLAIWLARDWNLATFSELGRYFGRRDHTTILHAWRSTESRLQGEPELQLAVEVIRRQLLEG